MESSIMFKNVDRMNKTLNDISKNIEKINKSMTKCLNSIDENIRKNYGMTNITRMNSSMQKEGGLLNSRFEYKSILELKNEPEKIMILVDIFDEYEKKERIVYAYTNGDGKMFDPFTNEELMVKPSQVYLGYYVLREVRCNISDYK